MGWAGPAPPPRRRGGDGVSFSIPDRHPSLTPSFVAAAGRGHRAKPERRRRWRPSIPRAMESRSGPSLSLAAVLLGRQRSGAPGGSGTVASHGGALGWRWPLAVAGQDLGNPGSKWARASPKWAWTGWGRRVRGASWRWRRRHSLVGTAARPACCSRAAGA
jgi:hypothetical protein